MRSILGSYIARFTKERADRRKFIAVLSLLAVFVVTGVLWALKLKGISMTYDPDPSDQYKTIETIDNNNEYINPITINLFDYDAIDWLNGSGHNDTFNQINSNRTLHFLPNGGVQTTLGPNDYTGQHPDKSGVALQGIVSSVLSNGYPVLSNNVTKVNNDDGTLEYLFNPNLSNQYVHPYTNVTGLFKEVSGDGNADSKNGWIRYDSSQNYAFFDNNDQKAFGVYETSEDGKEIGFFPFNQIGLSDINPNKTGNTNPTVNHHFGLTMEANFKIQNDGVINGQDMQFIFRGDDDMWVFIDNVLVLDIGGIHDPVEGTINFHTGTVTVSSAVPVGTYKNANSLPNNNDDNTLNGITKTIRELFRAAGREDAIPEGSDSLDDSIPHTIKVFYLERGGNNSNLKIETNIFTRHKIEVEKEWQDITSKTHTEEIMYEVVMIDDGTKEESYLDLSEIKIVQPELDVVEVNGKTYGVLKPSNNYKQTINKIEIPNGYSFDIREITQVDGYESIVTHRYVDAEGKEDITSGTTAHYDKFTITNIQNPTGINVNKVWATAKGPISNVSEFAPVSVQLYQITNNVKTGVASAPVLYGEPIELKYDADSTKSFTNTFTGLPVVNSDKTAYYTYTVREVGDTSGTYSDGVRDYTVSYSDKGQGIYSGSITITNTYNGIIADTKDITVEKVWLDQNGQPMSTPPTDVTVQLYQVKTPVGGEYGLINGITYTIQNRDNSSNYLYVHQWNNYDNNSQGGKVESGREGKLLMFSGRENGDGAGTKSVDANNLPSEVKWTCELTDSGDARLFTNYNSQKLYLALTKRESGYLIWSAIPNSQYASTIRIADDGELYVKCNDGSSFNGNEYRFGTDYWNASSNGTKLSVSLNPVDSASVSPIITPYGTEITLGVGDYKKLTHTYLKAPLNYYDTTLGLEYDCTYYAVETNANNNVITINTTENDEQVVYKYDVTYNYSQDSPYTSDSTGNIIITNSFKSRKSGGSYTPPTRTIVGDKTIDSLSDGDTNSDTSVVDDEVYRLYLTLKTISEVQPIDLLIVVDQSGSMYEKNDIKYKNMQYNPMSNASSAASDTHLAYRDTVLSAIINGYAETRNSTVKPTGLGYAHDSNKYTYSQVTQASLINRFLELNDENQYAIIGFDGVRRSLEQSEQNSGYPYRKDQGYTYGVENGTDAKVISQWGSTPISGAGVNVEGHCFTGTNYEAGLLLAQNMLNNASIVDNDHKKVMIFFSDGVPTCYVITQDDKDAGVGGNIGDRGGDTQQNNAENVGNCVAPSKRAIDAFVNACPDVTVFTVGLSSELDKNSTDDVIDYLADQSNGTCYKVGDDGDLLANKLESLIIPDTPINAVITDNLSMNVDYYTSQPDLKVTMTSPSGEKTVIWSNDTKVQFKNSSNQNVNIVTSCIYEPNKVANSSGTVTATFNSDYIMKPNYTYTLSYNVKVSETAKNTYKTNGYPDEGAQNTDYGNNDTSSEHGGFYSNKSAEVTYTDKTDPENPSKKIEYAHPVVQLDLNKITINKIWKDQNGVTGPDKAQDTSVDVKVWQVKTPVIPPNAGEGEWKLVNAFEDGEKYIIVCEKNAKNYALMKSGSEVRGQIVSLENENDSLIWIYDSGYLKYQGVYLVTSPWGTTNGTPTFGSEENRDVVTYYSDGKISLIHEGIVRYLTYQDEYNPARLDEESKGGQFKLYKFVPTPQVPPDSEKVPYKTITLDATHNWTYDLEVPASGVESTVNGDVTYNYSYFVEEDSSAVALYDVGYELSANGSPYEYTPSTAESEIIAAVSTGQFNEGVANITNTVTESIVLPNTGSTGNKWYTVSGIVLVACALLYGYMYRRKHERRSDA